MQTNTPWDFCGTTVRGPGHIQSSLPNQDAWMGRRLKKGIVLVAADGMGSRKHAEIGAKAACRAVIDAFKLWSRKDGLPVELLLRLIHQMWHLHIHPYQPFDCASTCLFVVALPDGGLLSAQLGDGLILIRSASGVGCTQPAVGEKQFSNETTALGVATSLDEWAWRLMPCDAAPLAVVLVTDGIADDLEEDKYSAFVDYLGERYTTLPKGRRSRAIAKELEQWPVPFHCDDKTLAYLWISERSDLW